MPGLSAGASQTAGVGVGLISCEIESAGAVEIADHRIATRSVTDDGVPGPPMLFAWP